MYMSKATICKNNESIFKLKNDREKCHDNGGKKLKEDHTL